ncbi:MAG: phage tail protein [Oscillospiraceae bacterium]|nr:phage tail protein [Oscillospiraceae bacterium]
MFQELDFDFEQSAESQNISDLARNLIVGYKFYVFIGSISLAFNRVSGIERTYNYHPLQEGGVNNSLTFLSSPIEQPSTLVFEDGGMRISIAEMKVYFNSYPKEILVLLCSDSGEIKNVIAIHNAVVSKISIGNLDAEASKLVVNNIEMKYTGFSRLNFDM